MNIFIKYFVNIKNSRIFVFIKRTFKKRYSILDINILYSFYIFQSLLKKLINRFLFIN